MQGKLRSQLVLLFTLRSDCICAGDVVAQLVEAQRYKPESRGFDSRWSNWNFSVT
jgi:hypothetical protein